MFAQNIISDQGFSLGIPLTYPNEFTEKKNKYILRHFNSNNKITSSCRGRQSSAGINWRQSPAAILHFRTDPESERLFSFVNYGRAV